MIQTVSLIEFEQVPSLFFYFTIFAVSLFFVFLYSRAKINDVFVKIILMLLIVVPVIIIHGFRNYVGTDYRNYTSHFYLIGMNVSSSITEFSDEPLFLFECKVLYNLFNSHVSFFVCNAIIINLMFFLIIQKNKEIDMLTAYIVFYFTIFPVFLNIERQGVACLCLWLGFCYLNEQKYISFILLNLIAMTIHSSSLMYLPFVLLGFVLKGRKKRKKKRSNLIILNNKILKRIFEEIPYENRFVLYFAVVVLMLSPLYLGFALKFLISMPSFSFFSKYITSQGSGGSMKLLFLGTMLTIEVVLLKFHIKTKRKYGLFVILSSFSCVCCLMDVYVKAGIGTRLLYFTQYGSVYLAGLTSNEMKRKDYRLIYNIFILASCLFYFMFVFFYSGAGDIFPYRMIKI